MTPPVCAITSVLADAGPGPAADSAVTGALTLQLRAAKGRSYAIAVTCTDGVGRVASTTVTVAVAKAQ